jgi:hypothetical protein
MVTPAIGEEQQSTLEFPVDASSSVDTEETSIAEEAPPAVAEAPPASTEVQAPVAAAPEPTPAPSVTLSQEQFYSMQRRSAELESAAAEAERQKAAAEIDYQARTRAAQLIEGGLMPDQAEAQAQEWRRTQAQIQELEHRAANAGFEAQAKVKYAGKVAKAVGGGVVADSLLEYDTPNEMHLAAKIQKLEADNAEAKQARVPAQEFGGGVAQAAGGELDGEALETAVGNGTTALTPAVAKKLAEYQKSQGFGG